MKAAELKFLHVIKTRMSVAEIKIHERILIP
jgi:hypothetical protein